MTETETKAAKAEGVIKKYMLGALGVGLVPIKLVDMAALAGIQLKMLHTVGNLYGVKFSNHVVKSVIASVVGGIIPTSFSANIVSLFKRASIFGLIGGMVSTSIFGGASTYAIGKVFIQHFESGGTFLTFDPKKVKVFYRDQLAQGKIEVQKSFVGARP